MHDTAYRIGGLVMAAYLPAQPARILEVGAQNVNGTLRDHSPRNAQYVGLDFEAGQGVDKVITGLDDWDVPDAHFDLVIASSVFEHDKAFWKTFLAMCRKTKPGGHVYVSAPSNGMVHRYPSDHWRFYPDSGLALEAWAKSEGLDVILIESFIAERETDGWNDFCAVFRVGASDADLAVSFVHEQVPCTNVVHWRSSRIVKPMDQPEDMRLLDASRQELQALRQEAEHVSQAEHEAREKLQRDHEAKIATLAQDSADKTSEINRLLAEAQDSVRVHAEELAAVTAGLEKEHAARMASELDTLAQKVLELRDEAELVSQAEHAAREKLQRDFEAKIATLAQDSAGKTSEINRLLAEAQDSARAHTKELAAATAGLEKEHAARLASEERMQDCFKEIAKLTKFVQQSVSSSELEAARTELATERAARVASEQRLQERFREIAALTRLLQERDQIIDHSQDQSEWLRQVVSGLTRDLSRTWQARLASLMPAFVKHRRQKAWLKRQGLFDGEDYAASYPDVASGPMDPLRHYVNHGMKEGRFIRRGP